MKVSITELTPAEANVAFRALEQAGVSYGGDAIQHNPPADTGAQNADPEAAMNESNAAPADTGAPADTAAQGVPASTSLVDGRGCPWDERIHAKSKTCKADKSWKSTTTKHLEEQGLTKDDVKTLEAELIKAELTNIPAFMDKREGAAPAVDLAPVAPVIPAQGAPAGYPPQGAAPVTGAPAGYPPQGQPPVQGAPAGYPPQGQPPVQGAPAGYPPQGQPSQQGAPAGYPVTVHDLIGVAINSQCRVDIPHDVMMAQVNTALQDPNNPVTATDITTICTSFNIQMLPDCINDPVATGKIYYILGGQ